MKVQVIEKKKGRINRTTGEEIKGNLRVCAYARVSTEKEEQINSYNSQLKYYEEKIKANSDWKYVGIYADEGITGTLDYKRDGFMKMMQDATNNKFDMIITKSISRFGRNTVDTLKYVRGLKEKNGNINPRVITFILKSGNEIKCQEDEKQYDLQQSSYEVGENYLQKTCEPCGMCISSKFKRNRVTIDTQGFDKKLKR